MIAFLTIPIRHRHGRLALPPLRHRSHREPHDRVGVVERDAGGAVRRPRPRRAAHRSPAAARWPSRHRHCSWSASPGRSRVVFRPRWIGGSSALGSTLPNGGAARLPSPIRAGPRGDPGRACENRGRRGQATRCHGLDQERPMMLTSRRHSSAIEPNACTRAPSALDACTRTRWIRRAPTSASGFPGARSPRSLALGAKIARDYGLPAVVGVEHATRPVVASLALAWWRLRFGVSQVPAADPIADQYRRDRDRRPRCRPSGRERGLGESRGRE